MRKRLISNLCAALLAAGLVACSGEDTPAPMMTVDSNGISTLDVESVGNVVARYPVAPLSTAEAASLAFMRQEEQLAHDVYAVSKELWSLPVFANISASEATHSAAVKVLLDRYLQPDPLTGLTNGTFKAPEFQALYDSLAATSRLNVIEALTAGVEIEELDIRDITAQKEDIDNPDILIVYDNLLRASRNHLRAFMKVLAQQGGTYAPKYITPGEFNTIVNGG